MKRKKIAHKRHRPRLIHVAPRGETPGTVRPASDADPTTIRVMGFGPDRLVEETIGDTETIRSFTGRFPVLWVDVAGLRDGAAIERIGAIFGLHPLALEDVVNVHERAKVDDYDNVQYVIARMAPHGDVETTEQLSLFIGNGFVISFQEKPGDCFDPVRDRIRKAKGLLRTSGADYLAYSILDAVVDDYFPQLEQYGERLSDIEDEAVLHPRRQLLFEIYSIRRRILYLRRAIWPLREVAAHLMREESQTFERETRLFLRDVYDHTVQIIDLLETYRDLSSGLMDVYLSSVGNRMNEIMKLLTIITVVFIPLNFLAGLYGMNFHTDVSPWNMPELSWRWGYPAVLVAMLLIVVVLVTLFWRKGWFASNAVNSEPTDEKDAPGNQMTPSGPA